MRGIYTIIAILSILYSGACQGFVIDKRAIEQVAKNGAAAFAQETLIKNSFEKSKKAQEAISKYTAIVHGNLQMIEKAKQDISAFKEGTANIKVLTRWLEACFIELKDLATDIPKFPFGTAAYSKQIKGATEHIIEIGIKISMTVTDGKVGIKGINHKKAVLNLIDPTKRLEIINKCIYELQRVFSILRDIRLNLYLRNNIRNAAISLTPTAVLSADMLEQIRKDVIQLWYGQ